MEHIWGIMDANDFVMAMMEYLEEKTQYGEDMSVLSAEERIFYVTQTFEMEVNNGGVSQFFYNESGMFAGELVNAFNEIGAKVTAGICQKAIEAFSREIPVDQDEREDMLDELEDEISEILEECDSEFYNYEDNLSELNYNYVMKNKTSFT